MLDLYDFQREIVHKGVLSHNKFFVRIDPAPDIAELIGSVTQLRSLALRCVNAQFPGVELTTSPVVRYGYGPTDKTPTNAAFSDTYTSFIVDVRGDVYNFFYKWIKKIVSCDSSGSMISGSTISLTGVANGVITASQGKSSAYEVAYKDDYISDVTISPTSQLHNKSLDCVLYRAYPIRIQEMALDASIQNSPIILTITWAYRDHKVTQGNKKSGSVALS